MDDRIVRIRAEERKYHEACYDNYTLFEAGTWLHKPVRSVMDTLDFFDDYESLSVLDLGCGVGRNSIPIAERLQGKSGNVVCVDLLQSALDRLMRYSEDHGVSSRIRPYLSDIADYDIPVDHFDYIVAVSVIEHVESESKLASLLSNMALGTKNGGITCIIMNSNIEEVDAESGEHLEALMEINLTTEQASAYLKKAFEGWTVLKSTIKPLVFNIEREMRNILLKTDCITWIVQKS
ncbi:methyltransferase domain-containing protein [Paenibacillus sp. 5J-6]|uniref:Methyltransferase domain-containing protein n=1 Tax=Paenibacillus silvestris TaxID=2606219 RepID=A0A6L8VBV1_9BACL|nr:class I SAM-dependent methyltransferase [Paenibacillus silvestris]MZQ87161.1 methyltransferase domain-containing protein [Paenibacillus silvestris]